MISETLSTVVLITVATAAASIFPSMIKMIALAKKMGIWVENDSYVPDSGDYILYDWQDNGIHDLVSSC